MSLFSSKPKVPAHVPKTGEITLTAQQFAVLARSRPDVSAYVRRVGLERGRQAIDDAYTEVRRSTTPAGEWNFGQVNAAPPAQVTFPDDTRLKHFTKVLEGLFGNDSDRIDSRLKHVNGIKGKAASGDLYNTLLGHTEPEGNYYTAPPPRPACTDGAPAVPPASPLMVNQSKGLAWLVSSVRGDRSAFTQMVLRHTKSTGPFPLGPDSTLLFSAYPSLVPLSPPHRGWTNAAMQQKYPSNIGGRVALDRILGDLHAQPLPADGDNAWYGLALTVLGAIITTQAFTDGNKRMARFAYVLVLLRGGVPMVVPDDVLGAQLGDM